MSGTEGRENRPRVPSGESAGPEGGAAVPAGQSSALAERLAEEGAEIELQIVAGAGHVFEGVDRAPIIERSVDFLARQLGG